MKRIRLSIHCILLLFFSWNCAEATEARIIGTSRIELPSGAFWIDNSWRSRHSYAQYEPVRWRNVTGCLNVLQTEQIPINTKGLTDLFISGSANPTLVNFTWLKETYGKKHPVYVIDLRQETHLFVNGLPISVYYKKNQINWGKDTTEISLTEHNWSKQLRGAGSIQINQLGRPRQGLKVPENPLTIKIEEAYTEEEVAHEAGLNYFRLTVPDYHPPAPYQVDQFLKLIQKIPSNSWLHFHCAAGKGRTTTFMVMRDILTNAKLVSLEDIIARQALAGGIDLFGPAESLTAQPWKNEIHQARINYIKLFYTYINTGAYPSQSFTDWITNQPDGPYKSLLKTDAYNKTM